MLRVALRSLLAHKLRLVLSVTSVILGVAFVAGSLVFTDTLRSAFDRITESTTADVTISPSTADNNADRGVVRAVPTVPDATLQTAKAVTGVAEAEGSVFADGAFLLDSNGKLVSNTGAPSFGVSWSESSRLSSFRLSTGSGPRADGEIAIDATTLTKSGLAIGGPATVIIDSKRLDFTITGSFTIGTTGGNLAGAGLVAFTPSRAQELFLDPEQWSSVAIAVADGSTNAGVRDAVAAAVGADYKVQTREQLSQETSDSLATGLSFITYFLLGFAAISLLVGSFLIFNTFSMLVAQRSREMALLRAIGATRRQVVRSVLAEAVLVGLVGAAVGIGAGLVLAIGLAGLLSAIGVTLGSGLTILPRTVVVGLLVGVIVTVIAAWLPARRASRVAPVEALRSSITVVERLSRVRIGLGVATAAIAVLLIVAGLNASDGGGRALRAALGCLLVIAAVVLLAPLLARWCVLALGAVVARIGGIPGILARGNALRDPRRTAATASALLIGLALVTGTGVIASSAKASTSSIVDGGIAADLLVTSSGRTFSSSVAETVAAVPGITGVARTVGASAKVDGTSTDVTALEGSVSDVYLLTASTGSLDALAAGEAIVDVTTANDRKWTVGSSVSVDVGTGAAFPVRIGGIYLDADITSGLIIPMSLAQKATGQSVQSTIWSSLASGSDLATVKAALTSALAGDPLLTVQDRADVVSSNAASINVLLGLIGALLALSVVIAVLGVVNTLALSVMERVRELGLLRAVGATRRDVRRMVRWESVVIAATGAILGILAGTGIGVIMVRALRNAGLVTLEIPVVWLIVALVAAAFTGILAAVLPARRAVRTDILEAIATT